MWRSAPRLGIRAERDAPPDFDRGIPLTYGARPSRHRPITRPHVRGGPQLFVSGHLVRIQTGASSWPYSGMCGSHGNGTVYFGIKRQIEVAVSVFPSLARRRGPVRGWLTVG
ncbi:hypothetical protein Saso_25600 [Streptomyces asoensis]|uniref:Uncharacterized protein n=1 Tax=Streptomyces asoensis TaxID=249586 RepID=A0ABQ3RYH2_9ACTN|nr:hypothetical protein GCM10010496_78050 [Streptomyces asoensis]GHI60910.1 hypothetical protein Saso_25600 [Streptomyces asoensis]